MGSTPSPANGEEDAGSGVALGVASPSVIASYCRRRSWVVPSERPTAMMKSPGGVAIPAGAIVGGTCTCQSAGVPVSVAPAGGAQTVRAGCHVRVGSRTRTMRALSVTPARMRRLVSVSSASARPEKWYSAAKTPLVGQASVCDVPTPGLVRSQ